MSVRITSLMSCLTVGIAVVSGGWKCGIPQSGETTQTGVTQRGIYASWPSCPGTQTQPHWPDTVKSDGHHAVADLDCDGQPENIQVTWSEQNEQKLPQIVIAGAHRSLQTRLMLDGLPQLVAFGDLNGDGLRDALLAIVDESTIYPIVVLTKRDTLLVPVDAPTLDRRGLQYLWDEQGVLEQCIPQLLPRFSIAGGNRAAIVVASNGAQSDTSCPTPQWDTLHVVADTLMTR